MTLTTYTARTDVPAFTAPERAADGRVLNRDVLKFAGAVLPEIGEIIFVTMNGIGPAVVTGYFTEGGYLGVLCDAHTPPAWLVKQNGHGRGLHVFGPEFRIETPSRSGAGCSTMA